MTAKQPKKRVRQPADLKDIYGCTIGEISEKTKFTDESLIWLFGEHYFGAELAWKLSHYLKKAAEYLESKARLKSGTAGDKK